MTWVLYRREDESSNSSCQSWQKCSLISISISEGCQKVLKDLISQLSFSPSAVGQLLFYARRLRQEEFTRRLGLVVMALAILVQSFSLLSPPVSSFATSGNDVIGVVNSPAEVISAMRRDPSVKLLFDEYGVTESNINDTHWEEIVSTDGYWSVGREPQGFNGEYQLASGFWSRPLRAWDTGANSTYRALKGTSSRGQAFWIIQTCGNIATREAGPFIPTAAPPTTTVTPAPPAPVTVAPQPSYTIGSFQFTCDKIIGFAQDKRDVPGDIHQITLAINSPDTNEIGRIFGVSGNFEHPMPAQLRDSASHQIVIYILEPDGTNPGIAYGSVGPCVTVTTTTPPPTVTVTYVCPAGGPNAGKVVTNTATDCPNYPICPSGPNAGQIVTNLSQCPSYPVCPSGPKQGQTVTNLNDCPSYPKCPSGPNAGKEVPVINDVNCPPTPVPNLEIHKYYPVGSSIQNGTKVKPGQEITYLITYKNAGPGIAYDTTITDTFPSHLQFVRVNGVAGSRLAQSPQTVSWKLDTDQGVLGGDNTTRTFEIVLKVSDNAVQNEVLCNVVSIGARGGYTRQSGVNEACNPVDIPPADCPYKPNVGIPATDRERCRPCQALLPAQVISYDSPNCPVTADCSFLTVDAPRSTFDTRRVFRVQASATNAGVIQYYSYDWGDGTTQTNGSLTNPIGKLTDTQEHTFKEAKTYTVRVTVQTAFGPKTNDQCVQKITIQAPKPALVVYDKKVVNLTKNDNNFNGKQADPGDELEYWLISTNVGDLEAKDVALPTDDLTDTADYATITQFGDAIYNTQTNVLTWNKVTIAPGSQVIKKVRFKIMNPLPGTPRHETRFDSLIENVYGSAKVAVKLPQDISKTTERVVVTTIPRTGTGLNIVIATLTITVAAYFYARSRLLKREAIILKRELTGSGA